VAETSGLLNRRTGFTRTEGSNPSVSASQSRQGVQAADERRADASPRPPSRYLARPAAEAITDYSGDGRETGHTSDVMVTMAGIGYPAPGLPPDSARSLGIVGNGDTIAIMGSIT
jgi:hypothetical protein